MKAICTKNELFIYNRNNFIKLLKPNSIAIFVSNDILPTNADGSIKFVQNSDLYYLSGVNQEDTVLLLFPDAKDSLQKEILFIKETSQTIAIWEGEKLTKTQAEAVSGIKTVYWYHEFEKVLQTLIFQAEHIYLNSNEHTRQHIEMETATMRFNQMIKSKYPLHCIQRSAPIMHQLRSVKHGIEIELIQEACNITEKGFRRLLNFIKPNVFEYEIEAELIHEFTKNKSAGFAYNPIIASGKNSCILHYNDNDKLCKEGDIILLDVGAEYAGYASDMTRVVPVSGKFTARQKEVYSAVLSVMKAAAQMLVPENTFQKYNAAVGDVMTEELLKLKLITLDEVKKQSIDKPAYKKYFMHGTSHFLGLDVHDVGFFYEPITAGMVFTVEPGIYIPEENIGIRLENNFVITNKAPIDLMKNIPIEIEEIENLMSKK